MLRWKEDQRPQRFGWAPGSYLNHCHGAGCKELEDKTFVGDKRAVICADCAYALPDPEPEPSYEERLRAQVTELLRRTRKLELEIEEWQKRKRDSST
jgi:hypothetical protein